jgi:hypothetical protein
MRRLVFAVGYCLLLLISQAVSVQGASWYVDNAATGTGAGTSWANAWTGFGSVRWGTGGVVAGDTLYISGGSSSKTYTQNLNVGAGGQAGNPLYIRVGQDAGHNGRVIFSNASINCSSYQYLYVSGKYQSSTNLYFNDLTAGGEYGTAIGGSGGGHVIEYFIVNNAMSGVAFGNALTVPTTIRNCALYKIGGKCGLSLRGELALSQWDKYLIQNCYVQGISSGAAGPDLIHITAGGTVANSYFTYIAGTPVTGEHPDMIQVMAAKYVKVSNNVFDSPTDSCVDVDFWFAGSDRTLTNMYVFNNVVKATTGTKGWQGFRFYHSSGTTIDRIQGLKIFNNTMTDMQNRTIAVFLTGGSTAISGCEIRNNILVNTTGISIEAGTGYSAADWNVDYNVISAGASGSSSCVVDGAPYVQGHGSTAMPAFIRYTPNAQGNDLRLSQSDVVARGAGANLSSYTQADIDGTIRSASGAWDIGAFTSSPSALRPPSNLMIVNQ